MQVKATIEAHSGNLEDAESACADIIDDDSTMNTAKVFSQRKGKRGQNDELLHTLQNRVHESGELLKGLAQPQPITAATAFANYVRDSLISMSTRKFRKARSRIHTILGELMDEESDEDEEETPKAPTTNAPARTSSASGTYIPTASEMYQPPPHMWRFKPPPASVWGSQTADYVNQYMQQPMQTHCQQQQPQYHQMMPPPAQSKQQPNSVSAAMGSASQVLNQSPSTLDTSGQSLGNMSGLSGLFNLSGGLDVARSSTGELNTPPPPEKN